MLLDVLGVLCGLVALAAIVVASPFVARLIGSSWPTPKYGPSPIQRALPTIRMYANIAEYAREKMGQSAFDDIMRNSSPMVRNTSAAACCSGKPTPESLTKIMEQFTPDPFINAPVIESDGKAYQINLDAYRLRIFDMPMISSPPTFSTKILS